MSVRKYQCILIFVIFISMLLLLLFRQSITLPPRLASEAYGNPLASVSRVLWLQIQATMLDSAFSSLIDKIISVYHVQFASKIV